jgi:hypothetical protein
MKSYLFFLWQDGMDDEDDDLRFNIWKKTMST